MFGGLRAQRFQLTINMLCSTYLKKIDKGFHTSPSIKRSYTINKYRKKKRKKHTNEIYYITKDT